MSKLLGLVCLSYVYIRIQYLRQRGCSDAPEIIAWPCFLLIPVNVSTDLGNLGEIGVPALIINYPFFLWHFFPAALKMAGETSPSVAMNDQSIYI